MIPPAKTQEDTIAVISSIIEMGKATTEEEVDAIRQVRESIYADYDKEDLQRMVRNVTRMFINTFVQFCMIQGRDPWQVWNESCMHIAKNFEE